MQRTRLSRVSLFAASLILMACSSNSSPPKGPDAKTFSDAPGGPMDAPAGGGETALGKKCSSPTDCPTNAPDCVGFQGTTSYCTPLCDMNATDTTNAMGQFTSTITPAPNDGTCTAAFTGTIGTPKCGALLAWTPMDNPPKANTKYTNISMGCVVLCGANNTCPSGMACNSSVGACFPM